MGEMKGLTSCRQEIRGFVGRVKRDLTKSGKLRIKFDLGIGKDEPEGLRYSFWRHCIAYEEHAERLQNISIGSLVIVWCWTKCEAIRDEANRPVIEDGKILRHEICIVYKSDFIQKGEYQKVKQLELDAVKPELVIW
jgi:hypothetical protein